MTLSRREFLRTTSLACSTIALASWDQPTPAAAVSLDDKHLLADIAIKRAKKLGATYADIRINRYRLESIFTREQRVQNVGRSEDSENRSKGRNALGRCRAPRGYYSDEPEIAQRDDGYGGPFPYLH